METDELLELIEVRRRALGLSENELSLAVTTHGSLVADIRRGRSPSAERLAKLCRVLELEFYVGPPRPKESPPSQPRTPAILAYPVEAAEIAGAATPSGCMLFTATFLREFGLDPTQLLAIEIENDEMKPLLITGGCAVVDVRLTEPVEGHIYAIESDEGQPLLRRVTKARDGSWQRVRDIPVREPQPWPGKDKCLGRVVWASRMAF